MPNSSSTTGRPAIEVTGLHKSFGEKQVLNGIDLTVAAGTVFALLGPNGAGKTTIVNILSTLIPADRGHVFVAGNDVVGNPAAVRAAIGVTRQFSAVDGLLTGEENLQLMGNLHHLGRLERRSRTADLLALFDLQDSAGKPASTYSGGMKRKLDLAMTLVGRPQVIFLDEPTTGLDPRSRRALWEVVRTLTGEGVTILLTTQYLDEADQLAHRVAVLDHGAIVAEGTPAELKRQVPGGTVEIHFDRPADRTTALAALAESTGDPDSLTLKVLTGNDIAAVRAILDRLERIGIADARLDVTSPGLDDVFLALTQPTSGKALR